MPLKYRSLSSLPQTLVGAGLIVVIAVGLGVVTAKGGIVAGLLILIAMIEFRLYMV